MGSEPAQKIRRAETSDPVRTRTDVVAPARREALVVGPADDPLERDADRVADAVARVLRAATPTGSGAAGPTGAAEIAAGDDPAAAGTTRLATRVARATAPPAFAVLGTGTIARAPRIRRSGRGPVVGVEGGALDAGTEQRIRRASGGGRPLDAGLRDRIRPALGGAVDRARIHTDSDVAPDIGARAFTLGDDVHFARGEFRPDTADGMHVLSHELAHVAQQGPAVGRLVVRRLMVPAYVKEDAGIHDYTVINRGVEQVKRGGITRSGILADVPAGTTLEYDPARNHPTYLKVRWNGIDGYVNRSHLTVADQIAGSDFYIVSDPVKNLAQVYDSVAEEFFPDGVADSNKGRIVADLTTILNALAAAESRTGLTVAKKRNVVHNVLHQMALAAPVDPGLWPIAAANLDVVKQRVVADRNKLIAAGLITRDDELASVEFTGADFHKGGQAPLFLRFVNRDTKAETKVVYKPGDLSVDRAIFGENPGGDESVAQTLDPSGNYISQYTIVASDDGHGHDYGFMEFVQSGVPANAADLLGVYRSLAENIALSYVVGLEDVHQENVLLLTNRVQVIDMEATTGNFKTDPGDLTKGGFVAMLWPKAISEGIKPKLQTAAASRALASVPATATVISEMTTHFQSVLGRAARRPRTMGEHGDELAQQRSRVVPVATSEFYAMTNKAKGAGSQAAWDTLVDTDRSLVVQAKGNGGHTDDFIKRLLKSPGTYTALARGEVPYYSRDLGGTDIFDEAGNRIDGTGCSKVGEGIDDQMEERIDDLRTDGFRVKGANVSATEIMKLFVAQILTAQIQPLNNELVTTLGG